MEIKIEKKGKSKFAPLSLEDLERFTDLNLEKEPFTRKFEG